jgi:hypothetical protein
MHMTMLSASLSNARVPCQTHEGSTVRIGAPVVGCAEGDVSGAVQREALNLRGVIGEGGGGHNLEHARPSPAEWQPCVGGRGGDGSAGSRHLRQPVLVRLPEQPVCLIYDLHVHEGTWLVLQLPVAKQPRIPG